MNCILLWLETALRLSIEACAFEVLDPQVDFSQDGTSHSYFFHIAAVRLPMVVILFRFIKSHQVSAPMEKKELLSVCVATVHQPLERRCLPSIRPVPISLLEPFDPRRSGCVLDVPYLIKSPLLYFNESFTQIFILKVCQLAFFWQRAWSALSQTVTFHSVAPPPTPPLWERLSCCTTSLLGHSCLYASTVSVCVCACLRVCLCVCVCFSLFVLSGVGTAAVEAVLSVPAPWYWRWFVTIVSRTCSSLLRHSATLSQTWWRQWWVSKGSFTATY